MSGETLSGNSGTRKPKRSDFCQNCGAWRGSLGLEPTPELYVSHLVQIFREVRRVLRDDGTVWLNLGSSYAGSWGDSGHRPERDGVPGTQREKRTEFFNREGHPQGNKPVTVSPPGFKPKDLIPIPWMVAMALQADGWWLRQDIIWSKPNPMPESVTDRCTKAHEYIFLLTKSARYFMDMEAVKEPATGWNGSRFDDGKNLLNHPNVGKRPLRGTYSADSGRNDGKPHPSGGYPPESGTRNRRSVWTISTKPFKEAHFATFPPEIPEICIKAGSRPGDTILDPFSGAGTTGMVAEKLDRKYIGIDLSREYNDMGEARIEAVRLPLFTEAQ